MVALPTLDDVNGATSWQFISHPACNARNIIPAAVQRGLIQIIRRHILGNSIAPDILCKHFFQYDHCLDAKWWGWGGLSQLLMWHHPWMAHCSISTTWVQYGGGGDYDGGGEVANSSNYLPGTRYCIKRIHYSLPLFPCSAGSTKRCKQSPKMKPPSHPATSHVAKVSQSYGGSFLRSKRMYAPIRLYGTGRISLLSILPGMY